ncbi:MAG TPA: glycosyltransferase family 39 protein [Candidatus Binatia bacterium]|nr:glycosyltransferase family 39 protein [Candidatus Binatia bacterium]
MRGTAPRVGRRAPWAGVALIGIVVATALLRLRLLDVPLDRDEGEFAYMGQLILSGAVPYVAAQNMKLPGAYYAFAGIFAALGETTAAIRVALLVANAIAIVLVARLGRRLVDATAGVAAAAAFALLSLGPAVLGFAAKAEQFAVPCVLGGVLLLLGRPPTEREDEAAGTAALAASGLLLGIAVVLKQHAAVFVAFGGAQLLRSELRRDGGSETAGAALADRLRGAAGRMLVFAVAASAPYAIVCFAMWRAGAFEPFWFWTVTYAREYATMVPLRDGLAQLAIETARIFGSTPALWLLAAGGTTAPLWDDRARRAAPALALFSLFSVLAVVTGFRFSSHYFVFLLPAASLWAGLAVSALAERAEGRGPVVAAVVRVGLPAIALGLSLASERAVLFQLSPAAVARAAYGLNPFPEAVEVARYVRDHSEPEDRIAVIGSEPEIYFYSGRRAATTFMYTYPLMEPHPFARRMQEEMIAQIDEARPRFVVLVNVDTSWTMRPDSFDLVFRWSEKKVNEGYDLVGVAEILPDGRTIYRWGADAADAEPQSRLRVLVFERR